MALGRAAIVALASVLLLGAAELGIAQGRGFAQPQAKVRRMREQFEGLKLTSTQVSALVDLDAKFDPRLAALGDRSGPAARALSREYTRQRLMVLTPTQRVGFARIASAERAAWARSHPGVQPPPWFTWGKDLPRSRN